MKELIKDPINFVSAMTLSDITANFVELLIRQEMNFNYFQDIFTLVVLIGLLRSIITFSLYWLMERYKLIIVKEEHEKRYAELLELLSQLKAELIFLRKSTLNLENAMKEGYEIYHKLLTGPPDDQELIVLRKKALNLAREIHEIKKDYLRISAGFSQLLPEEDKEGMRMSTILSLLKANTERWMVGQDKKVDFTAHVENDFVVTNYFTFFSILSNLIYNALDAIKKEGKIEVIVCTRGDRIKILVRDNGCGIDPRDLPYIFEPGFSSKILEDGSVSTGLGLTHVKNLVEDMGGRILVTSSLGKGSVFDVEIPVDEKFIKAEDREG